MARWLVVMWGLSPALPLSERLASSDAMALPSAESSRPEEDESGAREEDSAEEWEAFCLRNRDRAEAEQDKGAPGGEEARGDWGEREDEQHPEPAKPESAEPAEPEAAVPEAVSTPQHKRHSQAQTASGQETGQNQEFEMVAQKAQNCPSLTTRQVARQGAPRLKLWRAAGITRLAHLIVSGHPCWISATQLAGRLGWRSEWLAERIINELKNSLPPKLKEALGVVLAGPAVTPSSDVMGSSASVGDKVASGRSLHFVDRHRTDLIQRVTVVLNVCDYLLEDRLLIQEQYDNILALKPASVQMRKLYECSRAWGDEEKDMFLEILKKLQPPLIKDKLKHTRTQHIGNNFLIN
ncbi:UNVERIFIED_CONTAM: hypothetical protein FKN15_075856 [Acipenser sinensis]